MSRHLGATDVWTVDPLPYRRDAARGVGATATGVELSGEFDVIFDAVGTRATRTASVTRLRPGGVAVWLGLHSADPGFDAQELVRLEKKVITSFAYTDLEFREAVAVAAKSGTSWAQTFPLADGAALFAQLLEGGVQTIKVILSPGESAPERGR